MKEQSDRLVTVAYLSQAISKHDAALGAEVAKALNAALKPLRDRIAALEKKPSVKFTGTWERGKSYVVGDAATHHGGLWICQADTSGEPSQDFVGWKLAVKKGHA